MLFLLQNCLQSLRFYLVLPELLSSLTSTNIPQCEQCNLKERRKTSCILQGSVSTKGNHEQTVLATCELLSFFSLGPHDCKLQYQEAYFNSMCSSLSFLPPIISNKTIPVVICIGASIREENIHTSISLGSSVAR